MEKTLFESILGKSDERREEAIGYIQINRENQCLIGFIVDSILDQNNSLTFRQLAIEIIDRLQLEISENQLLRLCSMLSSEDRQILLSLGPLIAHRMQNPQLFEHFLSPEFENSYGVFVTLYSIVSYHKFYPNQISSFCLPSLRSKNQEISTISAKILALFPSSPEILDSVSPLLFTPLTSGTLPIHTELLPILIGTEDSQEKLDFFLSLLAELSSLSPFPPSVKVGDTNYTFSEYGRALVKEASELSTSFKITIDVLPILFNLCLLSDEQITNWNSDIESFIIDNFSDETDAPDSFRYECASFIFESGLVTPVMNFLQSQMTISPRHYEAALYIIYFLSQSYDTFYIDFPYIPEDPVCLGRLLQCAGRMKLSVEPSLYSAALEAEGFILPLFTAFGICYNEDLRELYPKAATAVIPLFSLFETSVVEALLQLLERILQGDWALESIPILMEYWRKFGLITSVSNCYSSLLASLALCQPIFSRLFESVYPYILEALDSQASIPSGYDLAVPLLCRLPSKDFNLPESENQKFFDAFVHTLSNEEFQSCFTIASYFVRCGYTHPLEKWLIDILNSDSDDSAFTGLAPFASELICSVQEEVKQKIFGSLYARSQKSTTELFQNTFYSIFYYITFCDLRHLRLVASLCQTDRFILAALSNLQNLAGQFEQYLGLSLLCAIAGEEQFSAIRSTLFSFLMENLKQRYFISGCGEETSLPQTYEFSSRDPLFEGHPLAEINIHGFISEYIMKVPSLPKDILDRVKYIELVFSEHPI